MTEAGWWSCPDPGRVSKHNAKFPHRVYVLALCACARYGEKFWEHQETRDGLEAIEEEADLGGKKSNWWTMIRKNKVVEVDAHYCQPGRDGSPHTIAARYANNAILVVGLLARSPSIDGMSLVWDKVGAAIEYEKTGMYLLQQPYCWWAPHVLRDVFSNPFRQIRWQLSWKVPEAERIALSAYRERDFGCLPYVADAIEEAGCDDPFLLQHLRGFDPCPGCLDTSTAWRCMSCGAMKQEGISWTPRKVPHYRGCWAVDLILGKPR